jgi:hypothetical protein
VETVILSACTTVLVSSSGIKPLSPFQISLGLAWIILLFRYLSLKSEEPEVGLIRGTTPYSVQLILIAIIGVVSQGALAFSAEVKWIDSIGAFALICYVGILVYIALDLIFLGEYIKRWLEVVQSETGDNPIGDAIRSTFSFGAVQLEDIDDELEEDYPKSPAYVTIVAAVLFVVFAIILSPILGFLLLIFGDIESVILSVTGLFILRDWVRYIYLNFGPAGSFDATRFATLRNIGLFALNAILLAFGLNYEIPLPV